MTLVQITRDYTTTENGITYNFKVNEIYEAVVPLGGNYVEAYRVVAGPQGKESAARTRVKVPNGYWQYTNSGVIVPPSPQTPTQGITNTSKQDTSIKYIVLGIVAIGLISFALMYKKK
jgi:hypothetical protein